MAVPVDNRLMCIQAIVASADEGRLTLEAKRRKHQTCDFDPESWNMQISASRPCLSGHGSPHREAFFSAQSALQIANSTSLLANYPVGSPLPPGERCLGELLSCRSLIPRGWSQSCCPHRVGMVCSGLRSNCFVDWCARAVVSSIAPTARCMIPPSADMFGSMTCYPIQGRPVFRNESMDIHKCVAPSLPPREIIVTDNFFGVFVPIFSSVSKNAPMFQL